jgi:hypothetical protein
MPCRAALLAYSPEPTGRVVWLTNGELRDATADRYAGSAKRFASVRWELHEAMLLISFA